MSHLTKARERWSPAPDWIEELASFADLQGLKRTATRVGVGASTVSQVLSNNYPGVVANVEDRVRGALMAAKVDCPILGEIGRDRCLDEQDQPFRATSAMRAQLFHACRSGCPHSKHTKGSTDV